MIQLKLKDRFSIFVKTYKKWSADDPFRQSAVIAYYAIFSLPALLLITVSLAGMAFGRDAVSGRVEAQISSVMGADTAKQIGDMIAKAWQSKHSIIASIIGFVTLVAGSIGVFTELQKSLNFIWEVKPRPGLKFWKMLKTQLSSFGLVLSIGFLMLVFLILTTLLSAFGLWISAHFSSLATVLLHLLNFALSFSIITVLFALMFKVLPDAKVKWRYVRSGAILTAFLFVLGKYALGFYFGRFQPASAYGAAGSIVLILLWVSYSCMILFFGAEYTKQLQLEKEGEIKPDASGVKAVGACAETASVPAAKEKSVSKLNDQAQKK
jgi:membrane protein